MATRTGAEGGAPARRYAEVAALLGLAAPVRRALRSPVDVHEILLRGLPAAALRRAVEQFAPLREPRSFESIIGMSVRTYQRLKDTPAKPLGQEQSGRLWRFAEVLAKAADVLGSREEAERWMVTPATGLDQRRPIDLLSTPTGTALVEEFLDRLDHGVYA
jgi:putative toxin-antitoxin system antitoxin component (TIGR02293 family)